jgi:hypothetical protein
MATIKLTGFNTSTGRSTTAGDTDTVDLDGSLTIGNADTDAVIFNAEIDSDFIPDDNDTYDLGSSTKRWAQLHVEEASFEDTLLTELSISGVQLQTDTNAYRFNCPYALEVTGLRLNLDQHGTAGDVTVTVANGGTTMITLSITGTNTSAETGTVTSGTRAQGDVVTFAITATPATNTDGLRASLFSRRTLS